MTDTVTTKKPREKKKRYPFPVELIDQLLAQGQDKNAESIHHERYREPAYASSKDRQESWPLSQRRGGDQVVVPGLAQYRKRLEDAVALFEPT
jgi:hypothetical protein